MNSSELILDVFIIPSAAYLTLAFLFRKGVLLYFEKRYSGDEAMRGFLLPYHKSHRALFMNKELDTAQGIRNFHMVAWGISGMGLMSIFLYWQTLQNGHPSWPFLGTSILLPMFQGYALARATFAERCFHTLGITSLAAYFQSSENASKLAR